MVVELILVGLLSPLLIAVTLGLERVEQGLDSSVPRVTGSGTPPTTARTAERGTGHGT